MKSTAPRGRFGAVAAAAAAVALAGGLAACGGNDSTVSSTPSVSAPATADPGAEGEGGATSTAVDPEPTGAPRTAPPETPQALPSDYPGPTDTAMSQQDKVFLDALRSQKIGFAEDSDAAVSAGNYVCAAQANDAPAKQIHATVLASIALDAKARGAQVDAEKDTTAFIETAQSKLCR